METDDELPIGEINSNTGLREMVSLFCRAGFFMIQNNSQEEADHPFIRIGLPIQLKNSYTIMVITIAHDRIQDKFQIHFAPMENQTMLESLMGRVAVWRRRFNRFFFGELPLTDVENEIDLVESLRVLLESWGADFQSGSRISPSTYAIVRK